MMISNASNDILFCLKVENFSNELPEEPEDENEEDLPPPPEITYTDMHTSERVQRVALPEELSADVERISAAIGSSEPPAADLDLIGTWRGWYEQDTGARCDIGVTISSYSKRSGKGNGFGFDDTGSFVWQAAVRGREVSFEPNFDMGPGGESEISSSFSSPLLFPQSSILFCLSLLSLLFSI